MDLTTKDAGVLVLLEAEQAILERAREISETVFTRVRDATDEAKTDADAET